MANQVLYLYGRLVRGVLLNDSTRDMKLGIVVIQTYVQLAVGPTNPWRLHLLLQMDVV